MSPPAQPTQLALVFTGGGARAAYQVGFLRLLAREFPEVVPDILTGVSAGGINASYLAARQEPFAEKVETLAAMWAGLHINHVFRVDLQDLASRSMRWGVRLLSGGRDLLSPAHSLVDTEPLRELLIRVFEADGGGLGGIAKSMSAGWLSAFALTGSSYSTGRSVTWIQTRDDRRIENWDRPQRRSITCAIRIEHVMASAALPFFFSAVQVNNEWFGDGSMGLTAPLAPAVHLGATRIIAVSTRSTQPRAERERPAAPGYPPPVQVASVLFNSIFLDLLDNDAWTLQQINQLVDAQAEDRRGPLRHIDLLVLRPSEDLGRLANEYEPELPRAFRFMTRGLGTRETRSNDLLSLVMFQGDYVRRLIDMGEADARARLPEIRRFLLGGD